jgi:TonB family protein
MSNIDFGGEMKNCTYGLIALSMALCGKPAAALESDSPVWQKITTDQGCVAYFYDRNDGQFPGWQVYHWTGSCTAGQLIDGQGSLEVHGLFFDERYVHERRGTMVGGYFQGPMTWQPYAVDDKGTWNSTAPLADLAYTKQYDRGCAVDALKQFCDQDRARLITAKLTKKPLWKDVSRAVSSVSAAHNASGPPVFSKTETVAFENLGVSLAELIKNVGPGGFQNEQAKIEAVVAQLGLSFYSGQGAAFGGNYANVQSVQNAVRTLLAGKGASADTGQLVDLVLGAVKDSLVTSKSAPIMAPVAPVTIAAPAPVAVAPVPRPAAAPAQTAPQPVATGPAISYATLASLPFAQRWSLRDVGRGCKVILRDSDVMQDASGFTVNGQLNRFEWTGGCGANGLAQGSGSLMVISTGDFSEGRMVMTGAMSDGLFTGAVQGQDQEFEGGNWKVWSDDGGPRSYAMQFTNGCAADNFLGPCNTSYGPAMRANYLAGSARVAAIPIAPPRTPIPAAQPISASSSAVAIGPKLLSDIGSMMQYPVEALRNEWQGRVGFSLSVSAIGSVQQCTVNSSSGYAVLDNATCDIMRRATFSPARNAAGSPVAGTYSSAVRWQVP